MTALSVLIAVLALFVSFGTLIYTIKSHKTQSRLTEREIELIRIQVEEAYRGQRASAAAKLTAKLERSGNSWVLRVVNLGPAEARDVQLLLNEQNEMVQESLLRGAFPMAKMENGQSVEAITAAGYSAKQKETLTIAWNDDSGQDRHNTVQITL